MFGIDDFIAMQGIGAAAKGLGSLFDKKKQNPYEAGAQYLDQIPGIGQNAYSTFFNTGRGMAPGLAGTYQSMYENPGDFYSKLGSGFQESPGYQKIMHDALEAIKNQAAAGGFAGSPMAQTLAGQKAGDIANQEFQQYIDNLMGITRTGLQGGEATVGRGFKAGQDWSDMLGTYYANKANLANQAQAWKNENEANKWSNLFSSSASVMPWMFGSSPQMLSSRSFG